MFSFCSKLCYANGWENIGNGFKFQIGMGIKSLKWEGIYTKNLFPRISRLRDTPMSYQQLSHSRALLSCWVQVGLRTTPVTSLSWLVLLISGALYTGNVPTTVMNMYSVFIMSATFWLDENKIQHYIFDNVVRPNAWTFFAATDSVDRLIWGKYKIAQ